MLEIYVSGVSTRKVSQVVDELCGKKASKSFISDLTQQLNPLVKEWQYRSLLETKFRFIMLDVLYIKVREEHRVVSKSCYIALGITVQGEIEQLRLEVAYLKTLKSFQENPDAYLEKRKQWCH